MRKLEHVKNMSNSVEIWPKAWLVKSHPQGLLGMVSGPEFHVDYVFDGPEAQAGKKLGVFKKTRSETKL